MEEYLSKSDANYRPKIFYSFIYLFIHLGNSLSLNSSHKIIMQ